MNKTDTKPQLNPSNVPIKPAATLVLLREAKEIPFEVFMVVRHHQIDVASGALVFPGGKVETQDADQGILEKCSHSNIRHDLMPFAVAVIREAFEETGVLLARRAGETALIDANKLKTLEHYREKLVQESISFAEMLCTEELELATDQLLHYAHWITPNMAPKRFDTHFFIAKAPNDQIALHDGEEAVDSIWRAAETLLKEAEQGKWKVVFPTKMNLEKLARFTNYSAIENYLKNHPPVTVQPEFTDLPEGKFLCIPKDADYPRWKIPIKEVMTP